MKTTVAIKIETTDSDFCYDCPALTNIESQFLGIYNFAFCRAFNQRLLIVPDLPEKGKWTAERCKDCIEYEKTQKDFVQKLSDMEKIYGIEESDSDYHGACKYRFYSLYNGTRGAWSYRKENVIKEGEIHQKIILSLHTHNQSLEPTREPSGSANRYLRG